GQLADLLREPEDLGEDRQLLVDRLGRHAVLLAASLEALHVADGDLVQPQAPELVEQTTAERAPLLADGAGSVVGRCIRVDEEPGKGRERPRRLALVLLHAAPREDGRADLSLVLRRPPLGLHGADLADPDPRPVGLPDVDVDHPASGWDSSNGHLLRLRWWGTSNLAGGA